MCVPVVEQYWWHLTQRKQQKVKKRLLHQSLLKRLGGECWRSAEQLSSIGQSGGHDIRWNNMAGGAQNKTLGGSTPLPGKRFPTKIAVGANVSWQRYH